MISQTEQGCVPNAGEDHFIKRLNGCARCHGDGHDDVLFKRLTHPLDVNGVVMTHWAPCPENGEPIMLTFQKVPDE